MHNKNYFFLIISMIANIAIGSFIGFLTKPEISTWYSILDRSVLTPPNYVFPVVWTMLYGMIGASGWLLWQKASFPKLRIMKVLYIVQLILNWSWSFFFFHYHLTGLSLLVLIAMNSLVALLIYFTYPKMRAASLLMLPYFLWILFASYLNFYIWLYN